MASARRHPTSGFLGRKQPGLDRSHVLRLRDHAIRIGVDGHKGLSTKIGEPGRELIRRQQAVPIAVDIRKSGKGRRADHNATRRQSDQ